MNKTFFFSINKALFYIKNHILTKMEKVNKMLVVKNNKKIPIG